MKPTESQIMDACRTRSATEAARYLWAQGYQVTRSRCETAVSVLLSKGERQPLETEAKVGVREDGIDYRRINAEEGCRQLLARQLATGAHWIACPERFAAACAEAGLV